MQTLINTEIKPFKAQAYQNGKFEHVSNPRFRINRIFRTRELVVSFKFLILDIDNKY